MEKQSQAILRIELSQQIKACAFSKEDLKTLCEMLQEANSKALEAEVKHHSPLKPVSEQVQADAEALNSAVELKVTVHSPDEETIYGTIPMVFNSKRFPDKVESLHINSDPDLRELHNWPPRNRFELSLDFTKPEPFNFSLGSSDSTPNNSNIRVTGLNSLWVHGVYSQVENFIKKRKTRRRFFHRHSVYGLILLCGGFPFAFSMAAKLSNLINNLFGELSGILHSAAQVYVFFIALNLFRALFDYARWIFPLVEYKNPTNTALKHRILLGALVSAVMGNFLTDVVRIGITLITSSP